MKDLTNTIKAAITKYATDFSKSVKSLRTVTQLLYQAGWRVADFDATKPNGVSIDESAPKTVPNPKYTQLWNVVLAHYTPEQQHLVQLTGQAVRDLDVAQRAERADLRKHIGVTIRNMGTSINTMAKKEARAAEILEVKKTVKIPAGKISLTD